MGIEERINLLEQENEFLRQKVEHIEAHIHDNFVTPYELADIMKCDVNTIYSKIRSGKIVATNNVSGYRIPMSQFYISEAEATERTCKKSRKAPRRGKKELTMQDMVFGKG